MAKTIVTFHLELEVDDPAALYKAALDRAVDDGFEPDCAAVSGFIGTQDEPDLGACVRMILDPGMSPPGTSIHESWVDVDHLTQS